ncbi:MAG TPA: hypothetical protein VM452_07665 [Caulifigura sp.]|jgi:hypothetical protein|nr:hypothetical protein [Caulifigura sp.]
MPAFRHTAETNPREAPGLKGPFNVRAAECGMGSRDGNERP